MLECALKAQDAAKIGFVTLNVIHKKRSIQQRIVSSASLRSIPRHQFQSVQKIVSILIIRPFDDALSFEPDIGEHADDEVALATIRFESPRNGRPYTTLGQNGP